MHLPGPAGTLGVVSVFGMTKFRVVHKKAVIISIRPSSNNYSIDKLASNISFYGLANALDEFPVRRRQQGGVGEREVARLVVGPVRILARSEQVARRGAEVVPFQRVLPRPVVEELDAFRVHVEYQREAVGYFQSGYLVLRYFAEVHQQSPDGVFAARYQDALPLVDCLRHDLFREKGYRPVHAVLQRFRLGEFSVEREFLTLDGPNERLRRRDPRVFEVLGVTNVVAGVLGRERGNGRRIHGVASSPRHELLVAVALFHHRLRQPGQVPVHSLV
mmetsp:Transcript_24149/g.51719  ORF Transcript_24149/g.51719 Transcript_24149/m.51719 type:complete len:275 (+) Transcript_24149:40-864(+)